MQRRTELFPNIMESGRRRDFSWKEGERRTEEERRGEERGREERGVNNDHVRESARLDFKTRA